MNILASIHLYPPHHNCGAEYMAHNLFKYLQSKGHVVRVLLHQANQYKIRDNYMFDGVDVFPPNPRVIDNLFNWSHAVFTHLDYTQWTISACRKYNKPLFHLIHNSHVYPEIVNADKNQHIVYNSQWLKDKLNYKWSNFILTPPVDFRNYDLGKDSDQNEYITLINLNENKGGKIFEEIARAMPNRLFLGVKGSYDDQIIPNLPNVKILTNSPNIKEVYAQTRILLMPSEYESWGRTATEAMCNGIPVICTTTPGLKENCENAAIYIKDRNDIKSWISAITKLDDKKAYASQSKKARERARDLDPSKTLNDFENWFGEKVNRYND